MFNKFALATTVAVVSATETEQGYGFQHGGHAGLGHDGHSFQGAHGLDQGRHFNIHQDGEQSYGHQDVHQDFQHRQVDHQPIHHGGISSLLKQDSDFGVDKREHRQGPSFGHLGGRFGSDGLTYGHDEKRGYGLYQRGNLPKKLRANDGYLVRARTDPHKRYSDDVYAKCNLADPEEENYVRGVVRMQQGAYDKGTSVWATLEGAEYGAELSINALGDLRDGCESAGEIFNPSVSASGYGYGEKPKSAPGMIGEIGQHGFKGKADVDLSGTWSVIGRSVVVSVGDHRVACCTIGLAAGPGGSKQVEVARYEQPSYTPEHGLRNEHDFGYGQEQSFLGRGRHGHGFEY